MIEHLKPGRILMMLASLVLATSCNKDSDPSPNSRNALIGVFNMEVSDMQVVGDSNNPFDLKFEVDLNHSIRFKINDNLDDDELEAGLEGFIKKIIEESYESLGLLFLAQVDDDGTVIAKISGNEFEIDDFKGLLTISSGGNPPNLFNYNLAVDGELEDDEMTMDFILTLKDQSFTTVYSGTAVGEKE